MAESPNGVRALLLVAAERIADMLEGCAELLRGSEKRAIDVFGPPIVSGWVEYLEGLPEDQRRVAIERLATVSMADARADTTSTLERRAPHAAEEDRAVALDYLTAIPAAARELLVPDPATGRLTLPRTAAQALRQLVHRMLPVNVPPFPVGSQLEGTPYILEELLGCGGFGAVYRARNRFEQLAPPRALKCCLNPGMVRTLERERELLDKLMAAGQSSNWSERIVRLYGHCLDAPVPFLVYEYVPGGTLSTRLAVTQRKLQRTLRAPEVLRIIRQVAEGLAFAHSLGLVHRDIKPANILVLGKDVFKLADFGIGGVAAEHAAQSSGIGVSTPSHLSVGDRASLFRGSGTPLYMSPEQRRGDAPDARHDIYSLGVMWYQLLVGDVTRELHPGWAEELREDFDVPQEHVSLIQRCVGYLKHRPANGEALLGLFPAGKRSVRIPGPVGLIRTCHLHTQAVLDVALSPDGQLALSAGNDLALRLWQVETCNVVRKLEGHAGPIRGVAFSPSGRQAASAGEDKQVVLWDLETGSLVRRLEGHAATVNSVAFSRNGQWLLSAGDDGAVCLWEISNGRLARLFRERLNPATVAIFAPNGREILSAGIDRRITLWDVKSGKELRSHQGHTESVTSLAYLPDGQHYLSAGLDATIRVWNSGDGREVRRFSDVLRAVERIAVSADGRRALSGGRDMAMHFWDVASGKEIMRFDGHANWVLSVAFSPVRQEAISASMDSKIIVWGLPEGAGS